MFLDTEQFGQAFSDLASLHEHVLEELLPSHGFPAESVQMLRNGDREALIRARLDTLLAGEREFMQKRNVTLPAKQTAATIADSDTSEDD